MRAAAGAVGKYVAIHLRRNGYEHFCRFAPRDTAFPYQSCQYGKGSSVSPRAAAPQAKASAFGRMAAGARGKTAFLPYQRLMPFLLRFRCHSAKD